LESNKNGHFSACVMVYPHTVPYCTDNPKNHQSVFSSGGIQAGRTAHTTLQHTPGANLVPCT
jgi:hypothetical protein